MNYHEILKTLKDKEQPVITVFGDFTLDKYLYVDAKKDELSLETGLTAYQITHKKIYAGSGGTITNNLLALGAKVYTVGIVGNDGEGYDLLKCLNNEGADTSLMIQTDERNTGTYIKPMRLENNKTREMNRLDIKNFTTTPMYIQKQLIENLKQLLTASDAIIISDQYTEPNCAAITEYVQNNLSELAGEYKDIIWYVDSRSDIHKFKNMILKCNHLEIAQVFEVDPTRVNPDVALEYSKILYKQNGEPVYITLGELGSVVYDGKRGHKIPAFKVTGEIDIVGAGDACNAGIVFALSKGANYEQAALVGNAASSIAIKMIGETGKAKIDEVLNLLEKHK